jgi:hypothetical protein
VPRHLLALALPLVAFLLACSGSDQGSQPALTPVPTAERIDDFVVGRPLERFGIGDVDAAFARYERTRADLIELYKEQDWFRDGLSRGESLFVERGLSFVAKIDGPRTAYISEKTIRDRLYRYDRLQLSQGEVEVIVIYEPGQNGEREMQMVKLILPVLESEVGIPYPLKVVTLINGDFGINDYNDGEFIRIDRCCVTSSFILAHELSHTYWSVAASWFNEGMADLTAVRLLEELNSQAPTGWRGEAVELESWVASRRRQAARYPSLLLPRRLASQGLYEAADAFLYDIRDAIGAADFRAAVRRIYLTSDYGRTNVSDFRVEETFLAFAEGEQRDEVMALFNGSIWGDNGEKYAGLKERDSAP